ncbi:SDR family oxidoreductase [Baekduia soli]|uniref:SDR family oxidoreductase n=1 Tax=Baekduia soli TaxID=496014 RepID=A0A5B8U4B7_9ACTN|nr:SDR family NAD(P)-dependent oxidoreductase [Baekduia soli]QEC47946.1 SDR family oxidoreductase [Baekduia soli]
MSAITDPAQTPLQQLVDLTGRTAVVTGAAKGIGLGIARRLHEAGADVVVADLDDAAGAVAAELEAHRPGSAVAVLADVSEQAGADHLVEEAVERFGAIDILVNNAGIYPNMPFLEMDPALFRRVLDVNLVGLFLCTQAAARHMVARGEGGRIINITSIDALHPSMVGLAHYDASKHGAWGFTKNIALELAAHGITVNAIAPGGIATPGTGGVDEELLSAFAATIPMHRMGDIDDIARAVLFLASDLSSYMTGSQVVVDGGKLLT